MFEWIIIIITPFSVKKGKWNFGEIENNVTTHLSRSENMHNTEEIENVSKVHTNINALRSKCIMQIVNTWYTYFSASYANVV